jgi:hypothetical protein
MSVAKRARGKEVIARFESSIDGYADATLNWYLPPDLDYLICPQWSFRRPVVDSKDDAIQEQWSMRADVSSSDLPEFDTAGLRSSTPLSRPSESFSDISGDPKTFFDDLPIGDLPSSVDILIDEFNRAVDDGSIQKPDFLAALLRPVRDYVLIIVEDKLAQKLAAKKQLLRYMNDFQDQYPYVLGLAFVMDFTGLYVGIFERSKEDGEIKQLENEKGISWMSPLDDFFYRKMIDVIEKSKGLH